MSQSTSYSEDRLDSTTARLVQLVKSHEMALLMVADTERKMSECFMVCAWLNIMATVFYAAALFLAVMR